MRQPAQPSCASGRTCRRRCGGTAVLNRARLPIGQTRMPECRLSHPGVGGQVPTGAKPPVTGSIGSPSPKSHSDDPGPRANRDAISPLNPENNPIPALGGVNRLGPTLFRVGDQIPVAGRKSPLPARNRPSGPRRIQTGPGPAGSSLRCPGEGTARLQDQHRPWFGTASTPAGSSSPPAAAGPGTSSLPSTTRPCRPRPAVGSSGGPSRVAPRPGRKPSI